MKKLIYAAILISVICLVAINANLPIYAKLNNIDSKTLGWIVAVNPLASLIFSFPFAYLSDKYNRFSVIFTGLGFYFLASIFLVISKDITGLFIAKLFEGLAIAAFLPAIMALRTDLEEKQNLTESIGSFTAVFNLGFIVAPTVSGLLGQFISIHSVFIFVLICSSINLILCIPLYFKLRSFVPKGIVSNNQPNNNNTQENTSFIWPIIIVIIILSFCFGYSSGLYDTVWAYYLIENGGNTLIVNLSYLLYAIPVVLLSKITGKYADQKNNLHSQILVGSTLIGLMVISYGFIPYPVILSILCSIEGVGNAMLYPSANAAIIKSSAESFKGRALGLFNTARTTGNFAGALLTSYVFAFWNSLPFIINGFIILVSGITASIIIYKHNKSHTKSV